MYGHCGMVCVIRIVLCVRIDTLGYREIGVLWWVFWGVVEFRGIFCVFLIGWFAWVKTGTGRLIRDWEKGNEFIGFYWD